MIERDELLKMARDAGVEVCFDSKFGSELYFSAMASWPAIERLKDAILDRAALECDNAMHTISEFHDKDVRDAGINTCDNLGKRIRALKTKE